MRPDDAEAPATVRGVRPKPTRLNIVWLVTAGCLYIGWGIAKGSYQLPIMFVLLTLFFGLQLLRPPTIVSIGGIRRPWHPRNVVAWGEVASIVIPTIGLPGVRLLLTSGKVLVLADIPSDRSEAVAAIGGKSTQRMPVPRSTPVRSAQQDPTPMEMEADVERRARALAEERRRMNTDQRWPPNRTGA